MNIELEQSETCTRVQLGGEVSIRNARTVSSKLIEASLANNDLEIDASGVTSLDTSIIQLLIASKLGSPRLSLSLPKDLEVTATVEQTGALSLLSAVDDPK